MIQDDLKNKEEIKYYVSIEKKLIYVSILKCASISSIEYLTKESDFIPIYDYDTEHIKNYNIFAIIRDPKSRWISGLNELMCHDVIMGNDIIVNWKPYVEQELKKNKFIFDHHTVPQFDWINSYGALVSIFDIILIRLDKNLNEKLSSLMREEVKLNHENTTSSEESKKSNLNFCKRMFKTYCEKNPKYYQRYEFDYRLFNISK